jgi:hypothetical protein
VSVKLLNMFCSQINELTLCLVRREKNSEQDKRENAWNQVKQEAARNEEALKSKEDE